MRSGTAIISLSRLCRAADTRPAAYFAEVVLSGQVIGDQLHLPLPTYTALQRKWARPIPDFARVAAAIRIAPDRPPWTSIKLLLIRQEDAIYRTQSAPVGAGCTSCRIRKLQRYVIDSFQALA
jgi:hypothetical protein